MAAKFRNGRVNQDVAHFDFISCLEQSRRDLDGLDRIAAKIEEIILYPDRAYAKHRLPDRHECFFYRRTCSDILDSGA
ncbi:hypothetical protein D3C71_955710 [compost metagenome]